jgi:hypothetical protein
MITEYKFVSGIHHQQRVHEVIFGISPRLLAWVTFWDLGGLPHTAFTYYVFIITIVYVFGLCISKIHENLTGNLQNQTTISYEECRLLGCEAVWLL